MKTYFFLAYLWLVSSSIAMNSCESFIERTQWKNIARKIIKKKRRGKNENLRKSKVSINCGVAINLKPTKFSSSATSPIPPPHDPKIANREWISGGMLANIFVNTANALARPSLVAQSPHSLFGLRKGALRVPNRELIYLRRGRRVVAMDMDSLVFFFVVFFSYLVYLSKMNEAGCFGRRGARCGEESKRIPTNQWHSAT